MIGSEANIERAAHSSVLKVLPMQPNNSVDSVICETQRLILRKFEESDAPAIYRFRSDPEVMRFSIHGPATKEGVHEYLRSCASRYGRDGLGQWAVILKSDGSCIGECGICVQEVDGSKEYEIGYRLRRDCWGRGFATEATQACRDYGFQTANLSRLVSIIEPENIASIRVAEKMGMKPEKHASFHGIATVIYSISKVPSLQS
jgi:ribosomal-protein-alanine N-acetyltransferase